MQLLQLLQLHYRDSAADNYYSVDMRVEIMDTKHPTPSKEGASLAAWLVEFIIRVVGIIIGLGIARLLGIW